jgi:putative ABC transport system permease protein
MILALAVKSLRNRKFTAVLTVMSIALAVMLLLGVERLRSESRESFAATISGTDLVVGARSSPVHLLLYAVFHIGNATNNLRWDSYRAIAARPEVAWTIPLSLGDSHRGYRVLGTTPDYLEHLRFGRDRRLVLAQGKPFVDERDAVLGADVTEALGYKLGDSIVIAHGAGDVSFSLHVDHPFRVVGVLKRSGTPVDRTVHVTLEGMDAVHADQDEDAHDPLAAAARTKVEAPRHDADTADRGHENQEHAGRDSQRAITAFLIGLKSRGAALSMQRLVNEYSGEPLTAILPGATLLEVWEIVGAAEKTLFAVSALVVVVGLAGMLVALLTSLSERRREMAVLRSVGARPMHIFGLILGEAAFLTLLGIALGVAALYLGLLGGRPWLESRLGLFIVVGWPSAHEFGLMILVGTAGVLIGLIPAYRIYRYSLADGMTIRI